MEENKKTKKHYFFIIFGFVLFIILLVTISLIYNNTKNNKTETSVSPSKYKYDKNKPYLTEAQIDLMYSQPQNYIGENLKIFGKVFSVEKSDYGYALQIFRDVQNSDQNTVVYYYDSSPITIKDGDYIAIDGYISDVFRGRNLMGGIITAPLIVTYSIKKSSYIDVCSPTIKTIEVNKTQSQYGCDITIDKVEFAETETRIYVTATNNSNYEFNIYVYSAKVTQAGKQYEYESNYEADYEELQTELLSGITSTGIITFPAINQNDFTLILEASSDNWNWNFTPYKYNINIQ